MSQIDIHCFISGAIKAASRCLQLVLKEAAYNRKSIQKEKLLDMKYCIDFRVNCCCLSAARQPIPINFEIVKYENLTFF